MTIQWLASKRIEGDDTEKDSLPINFLENGYSFTAIDTAKEYIWVDPDWIEIGGVSPSGLGGWKELGRTTLGAGAGSIDITSLADKRYYQILSDIQASSPSIDFTLRCNGDTGTNYAYRLSEDGAADTTATSGTFMLPADSNTANGMFFNGYFANLPTKEKLMQSQAVQGLSAGAATAPKRVEHVGKWANTVDAIDQLTWTNFGSGNYAIGSEIVVLGWDPSDDNTGGFWEELASATETTGDLLSSGAFNPKKYLWVQAWVKYTSTGGTMEETFNTDLSASYASRDSYNGGADGESPNANNIDWDRGVPDNYYFINQFIINNSANEKLCIGQQNRIGTIGAGVAPDRSERVDKWANNSSQITQIDFNNTIGGVDIENAVLKVWGSD